MIQGDPSLEIRGVSHNSKQVKPGDLFICVKGIRSNGHDFVPQAAEAGAVAVLAEEDRHYPAGIAVALVKATPEAMSIVSDHFYGHPSGKLRLIGITGTNGKTTSTHLCKAVFEAAGYTGGLIGTIRHLVGDREVPTTNTTPASLDLQALLHEMVGAGVSHVAMEVSSHAIALGRIARCDFAGGMFTNITLDHLDFHQSFEEYRRVKAGFFASLASSAYATINRDDSHADAFIRACRCRVITYGMDAAADIRAEDLDMGPHGSRFTAVTPSGRFPVDLNLGGKFNVYNALGVIGVAIGEGIRVEAIQAGLSAVKGVPGRFERVANDRGLTVIVDYAHTPDSLENILRTGRELTRGRLMVVFGCGGDRDRSKRPIMGRIAAQLADYVVVTSDNPRTEDPSAIIRDILPGVKEAGKREGDYAVIEDRSAAIAHAVGKTAPGDVLLIAGKGHETYQILRDRTIHFDDREVARAALEESK